MANSRVKTLPHALKELSEMTVIKSGKSGLKVLMPAFKEH